jgi:hypothetical protein
VVAASRHYRGRTTTRLGEHPSTNERQIERALHERKRAIKGSGEIGVTVISVWPEPSPGGGELPFTTCDVVRDDFRANVQGGTDASHSVVSDRVLIEPLSKTGGLSRCMSAFPLV